VAAASCSFQVVVLAEVDQEEEVNSEDPWEDAAVDYSFQVVLAEDPCFDVEVPPLVDL